MKFILVSVGTRGDIEPFLAVAQKLKDDGHEIICAFPSQFQYLAEECKLNFFGLSPKFLELVEGDDAVNVMGGKISWYKKLSLLIKLYKLGTKINKELVKQQYHLFQTENPDRVIFNGKSTYAFIWEIQNPGKAFFLSPVPCLIHPTSSYPHVGFKGNYGTTVNKLTYKLANFGLLKNITDTTKNIRKELNISTQKVKQALYSVNTIYTISPTLFKQVDHWPPHVKIVGYHERNKEVNWTPNAKLLQFIEKHKKILFFTFGSMTNPEPEEKTKLILEILSRNHIPAIINTASGGLSKPNSYNHELFHFEETIPYNWLFPKIYGVIHHGGSGTTHASIKYGCASMIVPHIIDQFHWNNFLFNLGTGPKGISVDKLTHKNLEPKIIDIFENKEYKQNAEQLALNFAKENLENNLVDILTT